MMAKLLERDTLWLCGEMQFSIACRVQEAYQAAASIGEECGYRVTYTRGHNALMISGGAIAGYYVVDWMSPTAKRAAWVEYWACETMVLALEGATTT